VEQSKTRNKHGFGIQIGHRPHEQAKIYIEMKVNVHYIMTWNGRSMGKGPRGDFSIFLTAYQSQASLFWACKMPVRVFGESFILDSILIYTQVMYN
jgi:hypothetical protein